MASKKQQKKATNSTPRKRAALVRPGKNGKGVFAGRDFAVDEQIGIVRGQVSDDYELDPRYNMELDNDLILIPRAPFRYLNHSCNPNALLFMWEHQKPDPKSRSRKLYVAAIRKIRAGQEITIAYGWLADMAIPCNCGSRKCIGYIVDATELDSVDPDISGPGSLRA